MTETMQQPIDRKTILNTLVWTRRASKRLMKRQIEAESILHKLLRRKRLLEAQDNPFNRHLIAKVEREISCSHEFLAAGREGQAQCGKILFQIAPLANQHLSFHDKCQVLGISHVAATRALKGDTETKFEKMAFCYALEYRGNEASYPSLDISTPFYISMFLYFIHGMEHNKELRQASTEVFEKLLSGVSM